MNEELAYEYGDKTILELTHLWEAKHLNLKPGFQRKSVWTKKDRVRLIQSLLSRYPIPSIFLYKREEDGRLVYDVIDGKQRLETIFMYTKASRFKRRGFEVKFQFDDDERPYLYDWKDLAKYQLTAPFMGSKIQVVEVSGDFASIVDLFVRINSTGKALTSAEKRHAKFYNSPFLKEALRLSKMFRRFLIEQRIITKTQINRMKDIELTSELLASVNACGPINKKAAVDRSIGNTPLNGQ